MRWKCLRQCLHVHQGCVRLAAAQAHGYRHGVAGILGYCGAYAAACIEMRVRAQEALPTRD
jgi:hypothetical protein